MNAKLRELVYLLVMFLFVVLTGQRDTKASSTCYIGEDDRAISDPKPFKYYQAVLSERPEVNHDYPGWTSHLQWLPQDGSVTVTPEEIGHYRGRTIYRLTYRETQEHGPEAPLGCTWTLYAYELTTSKDDIWLTPFFTTINNIRSSFESDARHSFMLCVTIPPETRAEAIQGVYSSYFFAFNGGKVCLVKREAGWHNTTRTFWYNNAGKLIRKTVNAKKEHP